MTDNLWILFAAAGVMVAVIVTLSLLGDHYTLNNIKSKTCLLYTSPSPRDS